VTEDSLTVINVKDEDRHGCRSAESRASPWLLLISGTHSVRPGHPYLPRVEVEA